MRVWHNFSGRIFVALYCIWLPAKTYLPISKWRGGSLPKATLSLAPPLQKLARFQEKNPVCSPVLFASDI
jgi:hypothetical protein